MNKHIIVLATLYIFVLSGSTTHAAGTAGLVDGLWFSHDPVTDFADVDVYSVVHNQTDDELQGIATLVVDGTPVGAQEVRVSANNIQRVGISYTFVAGSHTVAMSFTAGSGVEVTLTELAAEKIFVVQDTDGDGIQNTTDPDDDNDGISDEEDEDPLVRRILPRPDVNISATGKAFLESLTSRFGGDESEEEATVQSEVRQTQEQPEEGKSDADPGPVVTFIRNIEDARKHGAEVMREYEEQQRTAFEEITRQEAELATVEGFEVSPTQEGKKREHQIAAAAGSVTGTVLEHGWLFYLHIAILTLSVLHIAWSWFKRRFAFAGAEDEE